MSALGYRSVASWWLSRAAEETETWYCEVDIMRAKIWRTRETENVVDMSWWSQYAIVSKLFLGEEGCTLLLDRPFAESGRNAIYIEDVGDRNEDDHFNTFDILWIAYAVPVWHTIYVCVAVEIGERLAWKNIFYLFRLDAWTTRNCCAFSCCSRNQGWMLSGFMGGRICSEFKASSLHKLGTYSAVYKNMRSERATSYI